MADALPMSASGLISEVPECPGLIWNARQSGHPSSVLNLCVHPWRLEAKMADYAIETVKALALPEVRKKFDELGLERVGNTPAEFAAVIRKETPEWAKVIKDAGIKLGN
jgi:hypothetical protein